MSRTLDQKTESLLADLLALPSAADRQVWLARHADSLDASFAEAMKQQADAALRRDVGEAMALAELLLFLAERTESFEHRALGLLARANVLSIGHGRYAEAIQDYEEAAALYRAHGLTVLEARAQIGKINALAVLGRFDEAIRTGQEAQATLRAHNDEFTLARLTFNLAVLHGRRGDDRQALVLLDEARMLYERVGATDRLPWIEQNRTVCLRNLGRFDEALRASQTAYNLLLEQGQVIEAARAQQNLAMTYYVLGRYNEALSNLDRVREVFWEDGRQRDAMLVELFISDCLLQLRRHREVLQICQRVRELFSELGSRQVVAQSIVNEAVAYTNLHRYPEALSSLAEARDIFAAEENQAWVSVVDMEAAIVYEKQGDLQQSLARAEGCIPVFQRFGLPVEEAQAKLIAVRAAIQLGDHRRVEALLPGVLATAKEKAIPLLAYQGRYLEGLWARSQGQPRQALAALNKAIEQLEQLRGRMMLEFRAEFLADKQDVYEDAVELCLEMDRPADGLLYAERAKSRALLEMLSHRINLRIQAKDPADQPIVDRLLALRAERDRLYRRWQSNEEVKLRGWAAGDEANLTFQAEIAALEEEITEHWHRLLIRNADYARELGMWQVHAEPAMGHLPADAALLEYFVIHGEIVMFIVTAEGVSACRSGCRMSDVQTQLQFLLMNLQAVPQSAPEQAAGLLRNARTLLQRLHEQLIAPVQDALHSYHRLIIVPHGPLHYLPFHALHDGAQYLLASHEISYLPGSSMLAYCRPVPRREDATSLVVGHSYGGQLPHTLVEAKEVARRMDAGLLLEEAATVANVRERARDAWVVHFATHGDFRPDNPLFSGLALADGWLTTLDIFNLELNASLVTLSACETGRNVVGGGDELVGLMRSVLSAGAASVLLSLWPVEDVSTAALMTQIYRHLAAGKSKAGALRAAQLDRIAAGAHPYYWAPFFLVGDPGPL